MIEPWKFMVQQVLIGQLHSTNHQLLSCSATGLCWSTRTSTVHYWSQSSLSQASKALLFNSACSARYTCSITTNRSEQIRPRKSICQAAPGIDAQARQLRGHLLTQRDFPTLRATIVFTPGSPSLSDVMPGTATINECSTWCLTAQQSPDHNYHGGSP